MKLMLELKDNTFLAVYLNLNLNIEKIYIDKNIRKKRDRSTV